MARFIKLTKKGNACGHDGMEVWVKVSTIICITRDKDSRGSQLEYDGGMNPFKCFWETPEQILKLISDDD